MPSILRFLTILLVFAAVFAGVILFLGNLVAPNTRQMTIRLPPSRLEPRPVVPEPASTPPPAIAGSGVDGDGGAE